MTIFKAYYNTLPDPEGNIEEQFKQVPWFAWLTSRKLSGIDFQITFHEDHVAAEFLNDFTYADFTGAGYGN